MIEWVAYHRRHHRFSDAEGDPHSPHVGHGSGIPARCAACSTPTSAGCCSATSRPRRALRARPDERPGRPLRRSHLRPLGDRGAGAAVRAGGGAHRDDLRRADGPALGWGRADLRPAPHHLLHQLALPLLRHVASSRPATSRATSPGSRRSPSARPGTTITTPSRPPPATALAAWSSILGAADLSDGALGLVWDVVRIRPERLAGKALTVPEPDDRSACSRPRRPPWPSTSASCSRPRMPAACRRTRG